MPSWSATRWSHYTRLMPGRTLERQGRAAKAAPQLRMAAAPTGEFTP